MAMSKSRFNWPNSYGCSRGNSVLQADDTFCYTAMQPANIDRYDEWDNEPSRGDRWAAALNIN